MDTRINGMMAIVKDYGWLWAALLGVALILGACETAATPVAAVVPPTPTATQPPPTLPPPIRYALLGNAEGYVADMAQLQDAALLEQLGDDVDALLDEGGESAMPLLQGYDIVAGYGVRDGWQQSPTAMRVYLVTNPQLAPLNNPDIATLMQQAVNPQALVTNLSSAPTAITGAIAAEHDFSPAMAIREALANAGYPDGFALRLLTVPVPGLDDITAQLRRANFDVQVVRRDGLQPDDITNRRAHAFIVTANDDETAALWQAAAGEAHMVLLYTLPIRYRVISDDIQVMFTANGWPLPVR